MLAITPSAATLRRPGIAHALVQFLAVSATAVAIRALRIAVAWRRRREMTLLAHVDDRALADIGLSRNDVVDAFSGPPWEDPTYVLRARSLERRLARHAIGPGLPLS